MYYSTIYYNSPLVQKMKEPITGFIRLLHAVPNAPNVDVYINDKIIANNVAFGQNTDYISIPQGTYEVTVYVAGTKTTPVIKNMLTIYMNSVLTLAAIGTLSNLGFLSISDTNMPTQSTNAMVRFVHLSPNAPAVDITLPDGTILFGDVSFKQIESYIEVPVGKYTVEVRAAGTSTVVLTVPDLNLESNVFYTIYAIGLLGETPELEALLLLDGFSEMSTENEMI